MTRTQPIMTSLKSALYCNDIILVEKQTEHINRTNTYLIGTCSDSVTCSCYVLFSVMQLR